MFKTMFDKLKQLNEFRQKAQQMQNDLAKEIIEVSYKGVVIRVSANLELIEFTTTDATDNDIKDAVNRAIKEAQKIASQKMRGQMGDLGLNIPGL